MSARLADGVEGEAEGVIVAEALVAEFILDGGVSHDAVKGDEHGEKTGELVRWRGLRTG